MNLTKSYDYFQPEKINGRVHIIGCGSVGSAVAENLARCGVTKMTLWDFDVVSPHNVCNQMFRDKDVGKMKVDALKEILCEINPDIEHFIELKPEGWQGEWLSGYVFLAADSIDVRRAIVEKHMMAMDVKAMFDFRTELESAQHYAANWQDYYQKRDLLNTMQFSHEEAAAETPVSACGVTLGVATTVRLVSAVGVNNFIKFVKGLKIWKFCQVDGFRGYMDCYE